MSSTASRLLSAVRDLSAATDKAVKVSSELARIQQSNASTSNVIGASLARAQKLRREAQVHTFHFVVTFTDTQASTHTYLCTTLSDAQVHHLFTFQKPFTNIQACTFPVDGVQHPDAHAHSDDRPTLRALLAPTQLLAH
jgi:hypothetical protein